jgi:hypothetical protein
MTKGKVWNRGKHNGGGLPPRKEYKELNPPATNSTESTHSEQPVVTTDSIPTRVNTVQRMNRDNWVQRATPIKREGKEKPE